MFIMMGKHSLDEVCALVNRAWGDVKALDSHTSYNAHQKVSISFTVWYRACELEIQVCDVLGSLCKSLLAAGVSSVVDDGFC